MKTREIIIILICFMSGLIGCTIGNMLTESSGIAHADEAKKEIKAEKFTLVNEQGESVAVLGADKNTTFLRLLDDEGVDRVAMYYDSKIESGAFLLKDSDDIVRTVQKYSDKDNQGTIGTAHEDGSPAVVMMSTGGSINRSDSMLVIDGKDGKKRISFAVFDAWPRPSGIISDEDGNAIWSISQLVENKSAE